MTQAAMIVNLWFQDQEMQQFLHDIFVFILFHGLLHSRQAENIVLSYFVAMCMLMTRMYYGSCMVLWWKASRNIEVDLFVLCTLIIATCLTRPILPMWVIAIGSIASHFVQDHPSEQLIF